ncbi:uncharacterized protein LOC103314529 isoform X2 [Tribolium castaneum]|uniref:uncharacterized protein LOC103314529 isoform X2 n=1 Tax=Tribolium castaneum TaxID=7070 RepID=UPI00046C11D3|nr:PREDICTED: uncharacterized protein LOC103314529 [Tribolium castaneum]|eukprot:XP_008199091.1 PREDICTED: uncharacterized protein LOC103314529 [Tribolium castaneum]
MGLSNVQLLLLSVFLYFFAVGILQAALSRHIMLKGGTHHIQGWVAALIFILQSIAKELTALFEHGKKHALNFCLFSVFFIFFTFVFEDGLWVTLGLRLVFAVFNQVLVYSKEFVAKITPEETHIKYFNLVEGTRVAGLALGNSLGGHLFLCNENFSSLAMFSTVFTLVAILLMQYVEEDTDIKRPQTHFKQMPSICYHRLKNLKTVNYKKHWDCMLLQAAYTTTFSIYFVRFCFLLVFNYNLGTVVVGYSIAYQHMWLFATSMLVPFVKERVQNKKKLFEHSLLISGFLLPGLYYAPSYECYLFLLIPMFFCFMLVNALLDDDALGLSLKPDVFEASNTIAYLVNVIGPIFFGIVCQYFGGYGFKFFSLLPMVICVYLLNQRFMKTEQEQETEARIKQD